MEAFWIIIAQFICLAAFFGLLAVAYELDKKTPGLVRALLVSVGLSFFAVFLITMKNRDLYEHAAAISFTGVGALVIGGVLYMILTHQIQPDVIKVVGVMLAVSVLLWVVGNMADIKRQQMQIENVDSLSADYGANKERVEKVDKSLSGLASKDSTNERSIEADKSSLWRK